MKKTLDNIEDVASFLGPYRETKRKKNSLAMQDYTSSMDCHSIHGYHGYSNRVMSLSALRLVFVMLILASD